MDTEIEGKPARIVIALASALLILAAFHYNEHPCGGIPGSLAISTGTGTLMWHIGPFLLQIFGECCLGNLLELILELVFALFD